MMYLVERTGACGVRVTVCGTVRGKSI
jgi:hypothetical protein